jgi:hypothetical protein
MDDAFDRINALVDTECPNCGDILVYDMWMCPACGGAGYFRPSHSPDPREGSLSFYGLVTLAKRPILTCERCNGSREVVQGVCCPSCEIEFLDCDIEEVPRNDPRLTK